MPTLPRTRPIVERFWEKVQIGGPDDCWEWRGSRTLDGYGQIQVGGRRSQRSAHRVSYELANGIEPGGLAPSVYVCHRCDNPPCVNPAHLWLGTAKENFADAVAKGRKSPSVGEGHGMAKLTTAQVLAVLADDRHPSEIAASLGVSASCIEDIRYGRTWKHLHKPTPTTTEEAA